jgi:hypothetical protein
MFSERTCFGKSKCENDAYNVFQSKTPAWDVLHAILGRLGAVLGRLGTVLERSWGPLEAFLERSCGVFGLSWKRFGRSCGPKHDVVGQTVWNSRGPQRTSADLSATQRKSAQLRQGQVAKLSFYEDIGLDLLQLSIY